MSALIGELRELIRSARQAVVQSVDVIQVLTNFEIGRRIVEHEQHGKDRAEYGKALLKELSAELTVEFGRGFSRSNLEYMRKFFSDLSRPGTADFPDAVWEMGGRSGWAWLVGKKADGV